MRDEMTTEPEKGEPDKGMAELRQFYGAILGPDATDEEYRALHEKHIAIQESINLF